MLMTDVTIEYIPIAPDATKFQSIVAYHGRTASAGSKPSIGQSTIPILRYVLSLVKGTETLSQG